MNPEEFLWDEKEKLWGACFQKYNVFAYIDTIINGTTPIWILEIDNLYEETTYIHLISNVSGDPEQDLRSFCESLVS